MKLPGYCQDAISSKNRIDRIGRQLIESPLSDEVIDHVNCYRLFRLSALMNCMNIVRSIDIPEHSLLTARLKRFVSIKRKLIQGKQCGLTFTLSGLDDIIGIRLVCDYYCDMLSFSAKLLSYSKKKKDYIYEIKSTGYRAIHHIIKIEQELPGGKPVNFTFEVQLRTYYQNQWGIWSESFGESTKAGKGTSEVKNKLIELSKSIETWETNNQDKKQNKIPKNNDIMNIALVRRREGQNSSIHFYGTGSNKLALEDFFLWEHNSLEDPDVLLLAGSADLETLQKVLEITHSTYFRKVSVPDAWIPPKNNEV